MRKQWIIHIMILCGMTCNDPRTYSTVRVKHVIESVVWGHGTNNQLFLSHFTDKLNVNVHLQTNVAIRASVLNSKSVTTVENVVYAFDEESLFKSSPNLPATAKSWNRAGAVRELHSLLVLVSTLWLFPKTHTADADSCLTCFLQQQYLTNIKQKHA